MSVPGARRDFFVGCDSFRERLRRHLSVPEARRGFFVGCDSFRKRLRRHLSVKKGLKSLLFLFFFVGCDSFKENTVPALNLVYFNIVRFSFDWCT